MISRRYIVYVILSLSLSLSLSLAAHVLATFSAIRARGTEHGKERKNEAE